jgi:hypothetical protein
MLPLVQHSEDVLKYLALCGKITVIPSMKGSSNAKPNDLTIQYLGEDAIKCLSLHPSRVPRGRKTLRGKSQKAKWTADVVGKMKEKMERRDQRNMLHNGTIPVGMGLGLDGNSD